MPSFMKVPKSWTALCENCCTKFTKIGRCGCKFTVDQSKVRFFTATIFWATFGHSRKLYRQFLQQMIYKYDGECRQQGRHPSHVWGHMWLSSHWLWRESSALGGILYVEFYKIGQYKYKVLTDDHWHHHIQDQWTPLCREVLQYASRKSEKGLRRWQPYYVTAGALT